MKAVIMAGGYGKRLMPLTASAPKPMVNFFGRPIIHYIIELLIKHGFDDIRLALGYMADKIADYVNSAGFNGVNFSFFTEETPLGTAGSVKRAAGDINEPFLVISGDCICDFDLTKLSDFHISHNAGLTIACSRVQDPREYGVVEFGEYDKVKAFTEKPSWASAVSDYVNTGIYFINPDILNYIPEGKEYDFSKDLFPLVMSEGESVLHCNLDGYWCDIGNPAAYRQCLNDCLDGKVRLDIGSAAGGVYSSGHLPNGDYSIIPPCYFGRDVCVGEGSVIGPYAVLLDGCRTGMNSKIRESCLFPYSSLNDNCDAEGSIICENARIKSGVKLRKNSIVGASAEIGPDCIIGRNIVIEPEGFADGGSEISGDTRYGATASFLGEHNCFRGRMNTEFDGVNASIIGQAVASCAIGEKVGILTDGTVPANAAADIISGAVTLHGGCVWDFGEGFYSQTEFYVKFCNLKCGIFVSSSDSHISVNLCGENGLPLSNSDVREIENKMKYRQFRLCGAEDCKKPSDMSGVSMMYFREIIRQTDTELSEVSCSVKCKNDKIRQLLEDCLYRLGAGRGDGITFKINSYGNLLSAFSRECGWISHDRLSAIVLKYEAQNGRDVSVAFNSPFVFDSIAGEFNRSVLRFYNSPCDSSDASAREMSRANAFMRDALFMAVRLMNIICVTGKSLARLSAEIPDFYVSRRKIPLSVSPSSLRERLGGENAEITREGIRLNFDNGSVLLTPSVSGRSIHLISEAQNYEISKELSFRAQKMIENNKDR